MMNTETEKILNDEEVEILQEIMNIAFGQSAAELAEVIDTQVVLSVPYIRILNAAELPHYFKEHIHEQKKISIVEQKFRGKMKGDALLVFSSGAGRELVSLLQNDGLPAYGLKPVELLEKESLTEVGNILIAACVGKLAEVLRDVVTYTRPLVVVEKTCDQALHESQYDPDSTAIVLKTDFSFEKGNVSGFLFLVTRNESVSWLKDALRIFIEQYE